MALADTLDDLYWICRKYSDPASFNIVVVCRNKTMFRTIIHRLVDLDLFPTRVAHPECYVLQLRNNVFLYMGGHPARIPDRVGRMKKKPDVIFCPRECPPRIRKLALERFKDRE